jgi:hypothetical protein
MKINEVLNEKILSERRQQRTGQYYHGTSTKFLRSILKHGLLKNPPKRVYSPDGISDEGQRTFPNAVYLTSDVDIAQEAALWATDVFGGNPMVVVVQYVYGSGEMDEDVFTFKLSSFLRTTKTKSDFVKKFLQQFRGMKYNEKIVTELVEKLYDIIIAFMEENNISIKKLPEGDIINVIRLHQPYEEVVSELLRRVNPKEANTVRVPRDIGFSGKTRIIQIFNPETDKILYPVENLNFKKLAKGIKINSNVKPDTKYFMYGDYQEYIWGIGTTINDTIVDSIKEMAKTNKFDLKDIEDRMIFQDEWEMEKTSCQIYAMDEEAYNKVNEDVWFVMDKNEKGEITVSDHDKSKRKNESRNDMRLNEIILEETYDGDTFFEAYGYIPQVLQEAEYQGRKVTLNKPVRSSDGPKKFHVYVKNDKGNVVKVNFGDPDMRIKKNIPARKKSFRARHKCDTDPGPKWKARYWSHVGLGKNFFLTLTIFQNILTPRNNNLGVIFMEPELLKTEMMLAAKKAAYDYFNNVLGGQDRFPCGFAWVVVAPEYKGSTKLGKAERKILEQLGFTKDWTGKTYMLSNPAKISCQNVDAKSAGCKVAAEVLQNYGINAYHSERLD